MLQISAGLGSVHVSRRHFRRAAEALAAADADALSQLISRQVPPDQITDAPLRGPGDVNLVVESEDDDGHDRREPSSDAVGRSTPTGLLGEEYEEPTDATSCSPSACGPAGSTEA